MPRNLVLFDLEWNIGYQPYTFNYHGVQQTFRGEIVEIGAVKIDEDANTGILLACVGTFYHSKANYYQQNTLLAA